MSVVPALEDDFLQYWFQGVATTPRIGSGATSYLNICSASPGESGTSANELKTRIAVSSWGAPVYDAVNNRPVVRTGAEYSFATGGSGAATHFLLSDNSTAGTTHRFFDALSATVNFTDTDVVRFRTGQLEIALTGLFSIDGGTGSPAQRALDYLVGSGTDADQTSFYWGLSSTAPNPNGSNVTEPTGVGSYARQLTDSTTTFGGSTSGSSPTTLPNSTAVVWPEATASWGTMTHWVVYDAATSGSLMYYGTLDNPTEVVTGLQPQFAVGDLVLSCD